MYVSRLETIFDTQLRTFPLQVIALEMRKGTGTLSNLHDAAKARTLADVTAYARELRETRGYAAYDEIKKTMPQFLPAVVSRSRSTEDIDAFSELICLEYDDDEIDTAYAFVLACQNPHVVMVWRSLSEKPKILVRVAPESVDGEALSLSTFPHAWATASQLFEELGEADPAAARPLQPQNICSDPDLFFNIDATPLGWSVDDDALKETVPHLLNDLTFAQFSELGQEYIDAFERMEYNEQGIGRERVPCPFGGNHQHDGWGLRSNGTRVIKHDENDYSLQCFKCPERKRYNATAKAPIRHKPVRLKDIQPFSGVLETLDTARDFLRDVFAKGAQFFAIRTDTGTGKTEAGVSYAMTKDVVIPTQSHTLAFEVVARATDKEILGYVYKGIGYQVEGDAVAFEVDGRKYDADGYFGCIQSERFEALRNKGFNSYKWVCDNCPAYAECQISGYLSEPSQARRAQLVALPFPTAFLDPRLRSWADLYRPRGKNALVLHDDLPLTVLFLEYKLSADRLRRIHTEWKGTHAAGWAEGLLTALTLRDWEFLKRISLQMNDDEKQSVQDALTQCIDPSTGAVVEPDDYLKSEQVDFSTPEACAKLPQVDKEGFDIATMLEFFFQRYSRIADAPFGYEASSETFTFYMPPKPYLFNKTVRLGFASATLQKELIQAIFPQIVFYDAALTEWVDGAGFFQLRTNSNPRRTVLNFVETEIEGKKRYAYDGLSPTGESYYQRVIDFIKAHPNERHAVLSYKVLIEKKKDDLDALGVASGHFGNLAGLDEAFKGVKYFHILFCPEVDPFGIDGLMKQVFGNSSTPHSRDADGNLERNKDGTYADERAQDCYNALVIGEIRQVIGRARLNLYPNQVFLWTSKFVDGYTDRAETVLFDEHDWMKAENDPAKLREVVSTRLDAEQNGDVKEIAEQEGISKQAVYQRDKQKAKMTRQEKINEAYRLQTQENLTLKEIAGRLGVKTHTTVSRWLEKFDF